MHGTATLSQTTWSAPAGAQRPRLVPFDFSPAGTPDTDLAAGTQGYLDPFLGIPSR